MNRRYKKSDKYYLICKVQKFYDTYGIIPELEHLNIKLKDLKTYQFKDWQEVLTEARLINK
jgi:hypothetical protein